MYYYLVLFWSNFTGNYLGSSRNNSSQQQKKKKQQKKQQQKKQKHNSEPYSSSHAAVQQFRVYLSYYHCQLGGKIQDIQSLSAERQYQYLDLDLILC